MTAWRSYPKVYNLGHSAIRDIFSDPVLVEEKLLERALPEKDENASTDVR